MAEVRTYWDDIKDVGFCELPWGELHNRNILITGATGLIGSCIVDVLMNTNIPCNIYAAGRSEERARKRFWSYNQDKRFHFIKYDVTKPLNSNIDFQFIIDAASNASPNFFKSNPVEVIKSNINGVSNLIEYGKEHNLKRFLYISTGEIYGEGNVDMFSEDYSGYVNCATVRACYPSSKRAAESLTVAYGFEYNVDVVIARPSHVYGPYFTESDNRVYAQFIRNILRNEDIVLKSYGKQFRSWCYVVDCVKALFFILLKGKNGEPYNIADESSNVTIRELAELVASYSGCKVVLDIQGDDANAIITKATFDTSKLKQLGWQVEGSLKDKLFRTINERKTKNSNSSSR